MGIEDYLVSSTLLAVLAQRLVRKVCTACKTPYVPEEKLWRHLTAPAAGNGVMRLFRGEGCAACVGTGYLGRLGIYEFLVLEEELQRLILQKADANAIRAEAVKQGMQTMWQAGWDKVTAGVTTYEEVVRVIQEG